MDDKMEYKEFELEEGFKVRQGKKYNALFKNNKPNIVLRPEQNVYNQIFDFQPKAESISLKKDRIIIEFIVLSKKYPDYDLSKFNVELGYKNYNFIKKSNKYIVEIPYDSISISGRSSGVYIKYTDENGFSYRKKFLTMRNLSIRLKNKLKNTIKENVKNDRELYYSDIITYKNHSIFLFETWKG